MGEREVRDFLLDLARTSSDVADLAVTATDVYAAVNECSSASCTTKVGKVLHQGPSGFELVGATQPFTTEVQAIVAKSATEVIVTSTAGVWRWDGASWSAVTLQGGLAGAIFDLKYCAHPHVQGEQRRAVAHRRAADVERQRGAVASTCNVP